MSLSNILRPGGENTGGGAALYYTEQSNLLVVPKPVNGVITGNIILKPGQLWYQITYVRDTLKFKEDDAGDRHGPKIKAQIPLVIARDNDVLRNALSNLRTRKLVFLFKDRNGQVRLAGNKEEYLEIDKKYDSGAAPSNRNELEVRFTGIYRDEAPTYTGTFEVDSTGIETAGSAAPVRVAVPGPQGTSITGATIDSGRKLILYLSSGGTINAGTLPGASVLPPDTGIVLPGTETPYTQFKNSADARLQWRVTTEKPGTPEARTVFTPVLNIGDLENTPLASGISWIEQPVFDNEAEIPAFSAGIALRSTETDPGEVYFSETEIQHPALQNAGYTRIDATVADCTSTNTFETARELEVISGAETAGVQTDSPTIPPGFLLLRISLIDDDGAVEIDLSKLIGNEDFTISGANNYLLKDKTGMAQAAFARFVDKATLHGWYTGSKLSGWLNQIRILAASASEGLALKLNSGANIELDQLSDSVSDHAVGFIDREGRFVRMPDVTYNSDDKEMKLGGPVGRISPAGTVTDGNFTIGVIDYDPAAGMATAPEQALAVDDSQGLYVNWGYVYNATLAIIFKVTRFYSRIRFYGTNGFVEKQQITETIQASEKKTLKTLELPSGSKVQVSLKDINVYNADGNTITGFANFAFKNVSGVITPVGNDTLRYGNQISTIGVSGPVTNLITHFGAQINASNQIEIYFEEKAAKLTSISVEHTHSTVLHPTI